MQRRRFLLGGAALGVGALAGCSSPVPFDEAQIRAEYPPIGKFTEVWGLRVHYWEAGEGPPVVLVHGASGNLRDWTFDIAPKLAERFRVIAFDRPGFGYSDRPSVAGWDPGVQARVLQAASRQIGIEQPVVVGHSWGGALAMAWALEFPRETRGVVSVSGVTVPYGGMVSILGAIGLDAVMVEAYMDRLLRRAREGGIRDFIARVFRPQRVPPGYIEHVGATLALREHTLRANGEDLQNIDASLARMAPRYGSLPVPVEIIHGQADFIDWDHQATGLAELVPHARLNLLPGVGHMAHHAAPFELRRAVDRITARA
ncbi:alpha/beta hydrolase [Paralimibaculum aggregatum]|uniref:Alpha/beta hydrolase n=1 Tax=Paralimibaculum aggregatum TaxID=3036245 RepID=A0ABQ6LDL4_9RHOB|nr:alpha/beta fold hydrolase [Limibaculum sp. NKW23]GMG81450.1 alpha/beta hydrolase [Limibaculum sp. NKW23]